MSVKPAAAHPVDLDEQFIEVPAPVTATPHSGYTLAPNFRGEHRAEPVPPKPHGLVANVDPALEQQVFNVSQAERESDLHHHGQADDLGQRVKVAEGSVRFAHLSDLSPPQHTGNFALTMPATVTMH